LGFYPECNIVKVIGKPPLKAGVSVSPRSASPR